MGAGAPLKTPNHKTTTHNPSMTRELALSLLTDSTDGAQILQILETIAGADTMPTAEPTAEEIQF